MCGGCGSGGGGGGVRGDESIGGGAGGGDGGGNVSIGRGGGGRSSFQTPIFTSGKLEGRSVLANPLRVCYVPGPVVASFPQQCMEITGPFCRLCVCCPPDPVQSQLQFPPPA